MRERYSRNRHFTDNNRGPRENSGKVAMSLTVVHEAATQLLAPARWGSLVALLKEDVDCGSAVAGVWLGAW